YSVVLLRALCTLSLHDALPILTTDAVDCGITARACADAPCPAPESTFPGPPLARTGGPCPAGGYNGCIPRHTSVRGPGAHLIAHLPGTPGCSAAHRRRTVEILGMKKGGAGEASNLVHGFLSDSPTPHTKMSGGDLLSHTLPSAVPSAQSSLATGFGMEPGVSSTL